MKRSSKGFTLIELMVVVAVLSVLATLVAGGVTGTKSRGETSQVRTDAATTFMASQNFNNRSRIREWPEADLAWTSTYFTYIDRYIPSALVASVGFSPAAGTTASVAITSHTGVYFIKETEVRQESGGTSTASFVPDFLVNTPDSIKSTAGVSGGNTVPEYIWFFKRGTALDDTGRTIQVWKLNDDKNLYEKVYPRPQ